MNETEKERRIRQVVKQLHDQGLGLDDLVESQNGNGENAEQEGEHAVIKTQKHSPALPFDASAPGEVFKQNGILETFKSFDMVQVKADSNGFAVHMERKDTVRKKVTCPDCDGKGKIKRVKESMFFGAYEETEACRPCGGTGKVWRSHFADP